MLARRRLIFVALLLTLPGWPGEAVEQEIEWPCNEGQGDTVSATGGRGVTGQLRGAGWATGGKCSALSFARKGAHIAFDHAPVFDTGGPLTLEAWVYPTKPAASETGIAGISFDAYGLTFYTDGKFYWYVGSGGNKCAAAGMVRAWSHLAGVFDGERLHLYVNGVQQDSVPSQFPAGKRGGDLQVGRIARTVSGLDYTESFRGLVGMVRFYDRALGASEVQARYAADMACYSAGVFRVSEPGKDRILLTAYTYEHEAAVYADADFGNFAPLRKKDEVRLLLKRKGEKEVLREQVLDTVPDSGVVHDLMMDLESLGAGDYVLELTLHHASELKASVQSLFAWLPPVRLPDPAEHFVPPLAPKPGPPVFDIVFDEAGGFVFHMGGEAYPVHSTFSYPHGGENGFSTAASRLDNPESGWHIVAGDENLVTGTGKHYRVERRLTRNPDHVLVQDTFTNTSAEDVGIMVEYGVDARGVGGVDCIRYPNPSVYLVSEGHGVGVVALDDVFLEQHETFYEGGVGGLRTNKFALAPGASYTLEWALYPDAMGDYYHFINNVRRNEGLIRRVEGGFTFVDRRDPPTEAFVANRALKYASIGCLGDVADDPGISLEGIEFTEYPEECALLRKTFSDTRARYPDMDVMFHVAHSLFATDKPDELFPDSRTLDANGKQTDYGGNNINYYLKYFSKERVEEGYRWFIYYPAEDNAFGPAMLKATDFMLDELGVTGMFADGLTHGYGGRFTYDRWDGHTAEIDPETKTVKRKYASVNLLADPVLVEVVRRFRARGGVVIANSWPGTRTFHKEEVIYCLESGSGDESCSRLYLAPTVIALGDPGRIHCERDVYHDIRAKLAWGGLYFFYGEGELTRPTVTSRMYPITVEEIHRGTIIGRERIITTRSGIYGWPGDDALHAVYRYDGRGAEAPHSFVTSANEAGVRTELTLGQDETAVVERLPIRLSSEGPVNALVRRYTEEAVELLLHTREPVALTVEDGTFPIRPGTTYRIDCGDRQWEEELEKDSLELRFDEEGMTALRIIPVGSESMKGDVNS